MTRSDIGKTVLKKKVYLTVDKKKWCIVKLYNFKYDMQRAYLDFCRERGQKGDSVKGASCHYEKYKIENGRYITSGETGIVFCV